MPSSVRFASLLRDMPDESDAALIFIAPRASEVDALKPVLDKVRKKIHNKESKSIN